MDEDGEKTNTVSKTGENQRQMTEETLRESKKGVVVDGLEM